MKQSRKITFKSFKNGHSGNTYMSVVGKVGT